MDTKEAQTINDEGATVTTVQTVDHRSPAGENQEPTDVKVEVVHVTSDEKEPSAGAGAGKFLGNAAVAVSSALGSAKDAVMNKGKDNPGSA